MSTYMKLLGSVLIVLGIAGSFYSWRGVTTDEVYYKAARGLEKYPNNVLYQTEFKMAEPRHMMLVAGTYGSASMGIVLGSLCLAMGFLLTSRRGAASED